MWKLLFALPLLLVAGCASLPTLSTPYDPSLDVYDVTDQKTVDQDKADCAQYAADYRRPLNTNGIAVSGATGVSGNLGLGVTGSTFSPLAPLLGGIGGILQSMLQYVGAIDVDTPRAFQQCLRQRFDRDHSGILVEPPL